MSDQCSTESGEYKQVFISLGKRDFRAEYEKINNVCFDAVTRVILYNIHEQESFVPTETNRILIALELILNFKSRTCSSTF